MAHTSFGNFLTEKFMVKFKDNIDEKLAYFKNIGYADYRVGCDLCECGQAFGLKTNVGKFVNSNGFELNQLEIDFTNTWYSDEDLDLQTMWETSNCEIIRRIYDYYLKFTKIDDQAIITSKISINKTRILEGNSGITSVFWKEPDTTNDFISYIQPDELANIKNVHICSHCYKWLILTELNIKNEFTYQNPLKYFWFDFVKDYLRDMIDFESKEIRNQYLNYVG